MSDLRVSFPKPCSESWDAMRPQGCNRHCARCDQTIHDLAELTSNDVDALLRSGRDVCVRAEVAMDGAVKLKPGGTRRMVTAFGASVGLLAASGQAAATEGPKPGAIKGEIVGACGGSVSATAADGRVYHANVGFNGRYKVKRLPAGSYQVKFDPLGPKAPVEASAGAEASPANASRSQVTVLPGRTSVLDIKDAPPSCIVVGLIRVEDRTG